MYVHFIFHCSSEKWKQVENKFSQFILIWWWGERILNLFCLHIYIIFFGIVFLSISLHIFSFLFILFTTFDGRFPNCTLWKFYYLMSENLQDAVGIYWKLSIRWAGCNRAADTVSTNSRVNAPSDLCDILLWTSVD